MLFELSPQERSKHIRENHEPAPVDDFVVYRPCRMAVAGGVCEFEVSEHYLGKKEFDADDEHPDDDRWEFPLLRIEVVKHSGNATVSQILSQVKKLYGSRIGHLVPTRLHMFDHEGAQVLRLSSVGKPAKYFDAEQPHVRVQAPDLLSMPENYAKPPYLAKPDKPEPRRDFWKRQITTVAVAGQEVSVAIIRRYYGDTEFVTIHNTPSGGIWAHRIKGVRAIKQDDSPVPTTELQTAVEQIVAKEPGFLPAT